MRPTSNRAQNMVPARQMAGVVHNDSCSTTAPSTQTQRLDWSANGEHCNDSNCKFVEPSSRLPNTSFAPEARFTPLMYACWRTEAHGRHSTSVAMAGMDGGQLPSIMQTRCTTKPPEITRPHNMASANTKTGRATLGTENRRTDWRPTLRKLCSTSV